MSKRRKKPLERKAMEEPFGPPPKEYNYRCSVCGTELLVNEAIIDAGMGMAKFNKEYFCHEEHEGHEDFIKQIFLCLPSIFLH